VREWAKQQSPKYLQKIPYSDGEWLVSAAARALCHEITSVRCGRVQFDSLVIHSSGDAFYAQKQGSSLSWYVNINMSPRAHVPSSRRLRTYIFCAVQVESR